MWEFDSPSGYIMPEDMVRTKARNRASADAKRARLALLKMERGCVDCGYNTNAFALEFDHLPGFEKNRTVASLCWASWERIMEEVDKCEVVCANCHAIRTGERGGWK